MKIVLILTAVTVVLAIGLWFGLGALMAGLAIKLCSLGALLLVWAALSTWLLMRSKGARTLAPPVTKSFVRGSAGVSAMNDQFQKSFAALKSTRPAAFTDIPWYLVLGAPGSGKTTMMEESGLTFASFGAGSPHANGPTRSCDWWYTEEALFLDVVRKNDVRVLADEQIVADVNPRGAKGANLFEKARRIDDDAVANDGADRGP